MKKITVGIVTIFIVVFIFIYRQNRDIKNSDFGPANTSVSSFSKKNDSKKIGQPVFSSSLIKNKQGHSNSLSLGSKTSNEIDHGQDVNLILNDIQKSVEKCEGAMTEIFGPEDSTLNLALYTEYEITEVLKKFNQIKFNSEKMTDLMLAIGEKDSPLKPETMDKISLIKPCRMFQKINFLDEVRKTLSKSENIHFKKTIVKELKNHFKNEIESSSSVANLTMILNIMESFSSEKLLGASGSFSAELDQIIDQIEEDYEDVLLAAENSIENKNESGENEISKEIILKEVELNSKYKQKILVLIRDFI